MNIPRCALCPKLPYRRPIPSDGPVPCRLLFLGEGPSFDEDEHLLVFCGKTGLELNNTYLPILGIPRSMVHITNACWCSQPDYTNPTFVQAESCAAVHLGPLLSEVQPEIIVPMGAVACSLFPGISVMHDHGMPFERSWGGWRGVVFPMFHPSAGIHGTSFMIPMMQDMDTLRKLIWRMDHNQ